MNQQMGFDAGDAARSEPVKATHTPHMLQIPYTTIVNEVREYLARGEKLSAIECVKTLTGMGMHDAKMWVEDIEANKEQ